MLELKTAVHNNIFDIELSGALDSQSAYDFKSWMIQKNLEGYRVISLNCHGLEYLSSRGIGALVDINRVFKSKDSILALYHVSNEVLQLLEFLKLTGEIVVVADFSAVSDSYSAIAKEGMPHFPKETLSESDTSRESTPKREQKEQEEIINLELDELSIVEDRSENTESPAEKGFSKKEDGHTSATNKSTFEQTKVEDNIEYINLSESGAEASEFTPIYVYCPNCRQGLRIKKPGHYLCPECRTKFRYPFD